MTSTKTMQDLGEIGVTSMSEIQRIAELQENLRLVLHAEAESPDDARIKACIARIIDGIQNLEKAESTQQATAPPADHINNMKTDASCARILSYLRDIILKTY